jgi:glycosyltransferase involved in cell wall biosynthesis
LRVAFLLNDLQLSGGVGVVLQHARRLAAMPGWDVTLVLTHEQDRPSWHGFEQLRHLHVCSREQAVGKTFDVAVATWWETAFSLFEVGAERHAYFVQSLEDRFYRHEDAERLGAALTLDLPVSFITEARWIAETLARLRPDASCHLVRNGIDKDAFAPLASVAPNVDGPLRVLVEGYPGVWFKHVPEAIHASRIMREPHTLTVVSGDPAGVRALGVPDVLGPISHSEMADVYARTDVLLKLSSVEGMFGPPLEAFHRGATCVVTPVTGHDEYVEHGFNGLIADWEDLRGTARQLDLLARDRELLHFLRTNALEAARTWPSWEQASQFMAAALLEIAHAPPPAAAPASARMLADLQAGLDVYRRHIQHHSRLAQRLLGIDHRMQRLRDHPAARRLLALRRFRIVRIASRPLRPLVRRAKRALS